MQRVRLIHWKKEEADERAKRLRAAGFEVDASPLLGAPSVKALWQSPPQAVVIDLSRLPMQGRDLGMMLRGRKSTRPVPLVFVEGAPEKVKRVRQNLPDAVYTSWSRIRGALKRAMAKPTTDPVVPASSLAGYSGTPLPKKLGIKAQSRLALVGAPEEYPEALGELPEGVRIRTQTRGQNDRIVWFARSKKELGRRLPTMVRALAEGGGLWIAWPKKASGTISDLTQTLVRRTGLDSGLVDYKVCAIDATWSGLLFARRKQPVGRPEK